MVGRERTRKREREKKEGRKEGKEKERERERESEGGRKEGREILSSGILAHTAPTLKQKLSYSSRFRLSCFLHFCS